MSSPFLEYPIHRFTKSLLLVDERQIASHLRTRVQVWLNDGGSSTKQTNDGGFLDLANADAINSDRLGLASKRNYR